MLLSWCLWFSIASRPLRNLMFQSNLDFWQGIISKLTRFDATCSPRLLKHVDSLEPQPARHWNRAVDLGSYLIDHRMYLKYVELCHLHRQNTKLKNCSIIRYVLSKCIKMMSSVIYQWIKFGGKKHVWSFRTHFHKDVGYWIRFIFLVVVNVSSHKTNSR